MFLLHVSLRTKILAAPELGPIRILTHATPMLVWFSFISIRFCTRILHPPDKSVNPMLKNE